MDYSYVLLDIASRLPADAIRERFPEYLSSVFEGWHRYHQRTDSRWCLPPIIFVAACWSMNGAGPALRIFMRLAKSAAPAYMARTGSRRPRCWKVWSGETGLRRDIEESLSAGPDVQRTEFENVPSWDESGLVADADPALIQGDMQTIQNIMWHYVGLVRNAERLSRAIRELRHLWNEIETFYRTTKLDDGLIGLRNAVEVALIVAQAALHNRQSRGCHFRQDSAASEGDRLI